MYESMIFMNWIIMVSAIIYFLMLKKRFVLTVSALISTVVMIYADLLPIEQSMGVLMPVLQSHFWLTMHVLIIVASYGFFGLAMALGHRHLFLCTMDRMSQAAQISSGSVMYKMIQVGVWTLGVGTVLGGVWANESWGRFWGWDPKETWALITFLGYMVIVHLRAKSKLDDFGLAVSAILGFLLVLMTWYGVNFLLGRGLHSYGNGSGGTRWMIGYLVFEVLFVVWCFFKRGVVVRSRRHR